MANTLATPTWVTKKIGRGFLNFIKFVANLDRTYDDQYRQAGAKVGYTVKARNPSRFMVTDGQALQTQALVDPTVPITLTNQKNVAFAYSTAQQTMEVEEVQRRYIDPAAASLASACDVLAWNDIYKDVWNTVGTPGTTPTTYLTYLQAGAKLDYQSVPEDGRVAVLDSVAMINLANAASSLFNPSAYVSSSSRRGQFAGEQLGVGAWYKTQTSPAFTTGAFTASTPLVKGASQTGSSLITDGWASGATSLVKGDNFTIAGVYSVNPLTYQSTGALQQFTVTADISDTTGDMTIAISPAIITSGQYQTVDVSPDNDAAITVWGTDPAGGALTATVSKQSMVFHKDFAAFVMADLIRPTAGAMSKTVRSKQFGISIRWVEQYQIGTDQCPSRLDILIGAATLQPRMACRVNAA